MQYIESFEIKETDLKNNKYGLIAKMFAMVQEKFIKSGHSGNPYLKFKGRDGELPVFELFQTVTPREWVGLPDDMWE